ncbi:insulinase family protein [Patescibacteria group bacterium]|nr:insulinase family protein [Patescibacteria group bacterium]
MQHNIQEIKLKSGVPLIHIKGDFDFSICSFNIKSGFSSDEKTKNGTAHLLEHLFDKNNSFKTENDKHLFLDKNLIEYYAYTYPKFTSYYTINPNSNFNIALNFLIDSINNLFISRENLKKEKDIILSELSENNSNVNQYYWQLIYKNLFKNHSLANNVFGDNESIKKIKSIDLINFKNKFYTLDNIYFLTAGNFNIERIKDLLENKELKLNKKSENKKRLPKEINHYKKYKKNLENTILLISFRLNNIGEDFITTDFIKEYLCSSYTSALIQRFRVQEGITYWPESEVGYLEDTGYISFKFNINIKNQQKILNGFKEEIEKLKKIKQKDLEHFKKSFIINNKRYYSDLERLINFYIVQYRNNNKIIHLDEYFNKISNIKAEDISNFAKKYFIEENFSVVEIE